MITKRKLQIHPQLDVEIPPILIEEATCNLESVGVVYDIHLLNTHDLNATEFSKVTTLTIEELSVIHHFIGELIELRKHDPERRGK